jgi:hypothetical protein
MLDSELAEFFEIFSPNSKHTEQLQRSSEETPEDVFEQYLNQNTPVFSAGDPDTRYNRIFAEVPDADKDYVRQLTLIATDAFVDVLLSSSMGKSARFVRNLLLRQGYTTTAQVRVQYDPVAIFDLSRLGVPLKSERIRENGRGSKRYMLDPEAFSQKVERRDFLTPAGRKRLCSMYSNKCAICGYFSSYYILQVDHRVPFSLVGNSLMRSEGFASLQPLCPSCNSAKENACTDCVISTKDFECCRTCYWAYPNKYEHIATRIEQRLTLVAENLEGFKVLSELKSEALEKGLLVV